MGKTKFQSSWKKDRPLVVHVNNNVDEAMCRVCGDNLNVTSSTGVIKTHEKRFKLWNNLENSKNLSETLLVGRCSILDISIV